MSVMLHSDDCQTAFRPSMSLEADDGASEVTYRALSTLAVLSCVLGGLSIVSLLDWFLAVVPATGLVLGLVAYRRVRANSAELTGSRLAVAGICLCSGFLLGGLAYNTAVYLTEVPAGYQRISYDALQPDTADPTQVIPPAAIELDGKQIFIKGYMLPSSQSLAIKQFVLVRDTGDCCFGGNPKLTDMIQVTLKGGLEAEYTARICKLAGVFRVDVSNLTGRAGEVAYHLEADYLQ